jgi:hypothetical protein
MQESVILRTSRVAQIGAILAAQGGLPLLKIFGGTPQIPVNCAAPDPALLLCTITLPALPLGAANGVATMLGSWVGTASNNGFAQCYRLYDAVPTCHLQGFCSEPWAPSVSYSPGQNISNVNGIYDCTTGGVSASVGIGPGGTGSGIVDGSVVWNFVAPAAEMVFGTTNFAPGLSLPVQSFSITAANA